MEGTGILKVINTSPFSDSYLHIMSLSFHLLTDTQNYEEY